MRAERVEGPRADSSARGGTVQLPRTLSASHGITPVQHSKMSTTKVHKVDVGLLRDLRRISQPKVGPARANRTAARLRSRQAQLKPTTSQPVTKPGLMKLSSTGWKTHSSFHSRPNPVFEYKQPHQLEEYEQLEVSIAPLTRPSNQSPQSSYKSQTFGDAILQYVVTDQILKLYPLLTPGAITVRCRSLLSSTLFMRADSR